MKNAFLALSAFLLAAVPGALSQGAPPQGSADKPYSMEYYYKVSWGHQKEFLDLFLKNHFPLLQEIQKSGRILALKIETPSNHMSEEKLDSGHHRQSRRRSPHQETLPGSGRLPERRTAAL